MKTLFVSDLDGTLLRSNQKTSEYTNKVINTLVEQGMLFSYATARSLITAKKVTEGLSAGIPLILYNGAFIMDNVTEEIMYAHYFGVTVNELLNELLRNKIYPIVYAHIDGREKMTFIPRLSSKGLKTFTDNRKGDVRINPVDDPEDLRNGNTFYMTCIDEPEKLYPVYEMYKDMYHCVYHVDIYTHDQWLEIMPAETSKAAAISRLMEQFSCDKLVVFGDGKNDLDMFEIADEGYAVANADEELKKKAAGIIRSNDEDGVARWLEEHYVQYRQ